MFSEGRFEISDTILGTSSWKIVYEAFDRLQGRKVAYCVIKVDMQDTDVIISTLEFIRRVDHDYVAKIFDWEVNKEAEEVHVICELFTSNVREYVNGHDKIDPNVVRMWGRSLLIAIAYLHTLESNALILSIKSNNVLVHAELGTVKLDMLSVSSIACGRTDKDVLESKLIAPEMLMGPTGQSVDVYRWAMTLIECSTKVQPYEECETYAKLISKLVRYEPPACLETVKPIALRKVLKRVLVAPAARPTAQELLDDRCFMIDPEIHAFRFLVLDDDQVNRRVCCRILENEGLEAVEVPDTAVAMTVLATRPFDVLITDICMPVDGFDTTRFIRSLGYHDMFIIGVTAHATEDLKRRYKEAGMDAYINKPFTFVQVQEALRSATLNRLRARRTTSNTESLATTSEILYVDDVMKAASLNRLRTKRTFSDSQASGSEFSED